MTSSKCLIYLILLLLVFMTTIKCYFAAMGPHGAGKRENVRAYFKISLVVVSEDVVVLSVLFSGVLFETWVP